MNIEMSFTAQGHVNQTIEITDPELKEKSSDEIIAMLQRGDLLTTVQDGGKVMTPALKVVGRVETNEVSLEYDDFEEDW